MDLTLSPLVVLFLLLTGIAVGTASGMLGIGGAIMVIPVLIFVFHFRQQLANGTSLAMLLPPIGIFAVMKYHSAGNINWPVAMLLAVGFAAGAYFGAVLSNTGKISEPTLRFWFSMLLLYVAGRMLFRSNQQVLAALQTCGLMVGFAFVYVMMRVLGKRWSRAPYWPAVFQDRSKLPTQQDYEI